MEAFLGNNVELTNSELLTLATWLSSEEGYQMAREIYDSTIRGLSVRSTNILHSFYSDNKPTPDYIRRLIKLNYFDLRDLPNCGRKSVKEILDYTARFRSLLYRAFVSSNRETIQSIEESQDSQQGPIDIQLLLTDIEDLMIGLSNRSRNAINALLDETGRNVQNLYDHITANDFNCRDLHNIGRKSYPEVKKWCESVISLVRSHLPADHPDLLPPPSTSNPVLPRLAPRKLPAYIEELQPIFRQKLSEISVRSRNAISSLFDACDHSLINFYNEITSARFSVWALHNIGKGSLEEVTKALSDIKILIEGYVENATEEIVKADAYDSRLSALLPNADMRHQVIELERALGYFPFFRAIQCVIDSNLTERQHIIMEGCIRYKEGQVLANREELAAGLHLTRERARQIRNKLLDLLSAEFRAVKNFHPEAQCPYSCLMHEVNKEINAAEGTEFSLDFVHWIIGTIFDEYSFIGEPERTLTTPFSTGGFIALVPSELVTVFHFNAFMADIESRIPKKRMDDEEVSLKSMIARHVRVLLYEKKYPEIENACHSIISLHYNLDVVDGKIIFKANTYKPFPDIIYDLIRKNGAPMTAEQLIYEIKVQYPGRRFNPEIVGANALRHPKVIAVGRTGTYTLKEWQSGTERGGTIRDFVCEYLDSLEVPIARADEIGEYVRRFRPESSDASISANLLQEKSHKFSLYEKDGVRYYGYTGIEYDPSFKCIGGTYIRKRPIAVSMRLLEEFVLANGHYPYCGDVDEEEYRLYRFVGNRRSAYVRGTMPEEEAIQWRTFEEKYREYDIPRKRKCHSKYRVENFPLTLFPELED